MSRTSLAIALCLVFDAAHAQPVEPPPAAPIDPPPPEAAPPEASPEAAPIDPPPPAVSHEAALAPIDPPAGWARVPNERIVWRNAAGNFVSVAADTGTCRERRGFVDDRYPGYFRMPGVLSDRDTYCLQRKDDVALVTVGVTGVDTMVVTVPVLPATTWLLSEIRDRLRPEVQVPVLDVAVQPLLPVEATADGLVVHGADEPVTIALAATPGACGALPRGFDDGHVTPMAGERWSGDVRIEGDAVVFCLERRDDAVEVIVTGGGAPHWLDPAVRDVLHALHVAVMGASPHGVPRFFGGGHEALALPRTGVHLRDTVWLDAGWQVRARPALRFKLVDGAAFGEPDSDLLLPTRPYRYAIAFRRAACADTLVPHDPPADALFPAQLSAIRADGAGKVVRAEACAAAPAETFVVVVRALGGHGFADDPRIARAVTTAFARSAGVEVPGRAFRNETLLLLSAPIVRSVDATRWGVAMRMRSRGVWGRPYGVAAQVDLAFGLAGDHWRPGPEPDDGEEGAAETDGLGEARVALGGAASLGDFALDAMAGVAWQRFWPDGDWLEASIGLGVHLGRNRLQARYTRTILRPADAAEVVLAVPPVAIYAKATRFPTDEPRHTELGRPRLGLEFGAGYAF